MRVRWKRWLGRLHRFAWLVAGALLVCFALDSVLALNTLGLRVASAVVFVAGAALLFTDVFAAWFVPLSKLGLAQLLEKRFPELAERLVTLVQLKAEEASSEFAQMLQSETEQKLADVEPAAACPFTLERKAWMRTLGFFVFVVIGLGFTTDVGSFGQRFFSAWMTPLVPFTIEVIPTTGYALHGDNFTIEAALHRNDERAPLPTECELLYDDESGTPMSILMEPKSDGRFAAVLKNLRRPIIGRIKAGEVESDSFSVLLIDAPVFAAKPAIVLSPPGYLKAEPTRIPFDPAGTKRADVLRYSKLRFDLLLDRTPVRGWVRIKSADRKEGEVITMVPAQWRSNQRPEIPEVVAGEVGRFAADLVLELEHGLTKTLPLGQWTVHEDEAPHFAERLRFQDGSALHSTSEYRVSPGDALKLHTIVEDSEGLGTISFEYQVNKEPPHKKKWLLAEGKKKFVIAHWLPLPSTLKETDRVQFRVHAVDNRHLKKGEAGLANGTPLPASELMPQLTSVPSTSGGESAWIVLRIDRTVEDFLKQQAKAQSDEVLERINEIRRKVQSEIDQVQQLQKPIHLQAAVTLAQMKEAEKLRAFNHEIFQDLLSAAKHFQGNPELAKLAGHFLDIADIEMTKSAEALQRFGEKDRTRAEAEQELQKAQDALLEARKKLDRLANLNKILAQDRLDQFQLDKLAKRQEELAERLEKLLGEAPPSDADLAKQIDAIRDEQAKLAEQAALMQEKSPLVKDSAQSLQQMEIERAASEAQKLAAEQRAQREMAPDKLPAEIKERLDKLAKRQADLARRVAPFAPSNQGPDAKPAEAAADALKKPIIDLAIQKQMEHEKRLQEWVDKLMPGAAANTLREQVLQLAKKQQAIRADLERFVADAPDLDFDALQTRLRNLAERQKEMPAAIARLKIDAADHQALQKNALQTASIAADQMARENAAGAPAAHPLMRKTQQELEALAAQMPTTLPTKRSDINDPMTLAKLDKFEGFAKDQKQLREETQKLLEDATKSSAGNGKGPLGEKIDKLAAELLELAQKQSTPEAKAMAKESAETLASAKKAMDESQGMKAKGDPEQAKEMDAKAEKQLELAAKQLAKLTQDQAKAMPKDDNAKTAEALKEGVQQMRKAEATLPTMPKDAQAAMKAAAKNLDQAARQAAKQSASKVPLAANNPAAGVPPLGRATGSVAKDLKLEALTGQSWGQLPGELKTRMLQDARSRFGAEYAETIRQYFESLAETPADRREKK